MVVAVIEVIWSPPISWLDRLPGLRHDPGGYCYRIYYEDGRKRICGTYSRAPDEEHVKRHAKRSARKAGFTHYRMISDQHVQELP